MDSDKTFEPKRQQPDASDDQVTKVMSEPTAQPATAPTPPTVAGYRIKELLGAGGMGEVWRAEQLHPLQRPVAVKVIKRGMDSAAVLERFKHEWRAMALMAHPAIANVYEAGMIEDGRPFMAMEYIPGEAITDYCDRFRLSLIARLDLFLKVCDGIEHAHQKGIIHRDLKPANVLVTVQDREPDPKIVDFGLAKAFGKAIDAESGHTVVGEFLGTPTYMSPEQFDLTGIDIDTRSDIYSLGVLLYRLLVGVVPIDAQTLGNGPLEAMRHAARISEPPRPSKRLESLLAEIGATSNVQPAADIQPGQLRGDLDWILLKCLDKDRTHRYQTANALGMDLRRYLKGEPVLARPPSFRYRTGKLIARHRAAAASILLLVISLLAGTAGTTIGMLKAKEAEEMAQTEARHARETSDFLVELFRVAAPNRAQGEEITARQLLDNGRLRIGQALGAQPAARARFMSTMGEIYLQLALYDEASTLLNDALALQETQPGDHSEEKARTLQFLSQIDRERGNYDRASARAERAIQLLEQHGSTDAPLLAKALIAKGWALQTQGNYEDSKAAFMAALALAEDLPLVEWDPLLASARHGLGTIQMRQGANAAAEDNLQAALAGYEQINQANDKELTSVGNTLNDLATVYLNTGKTRLALPLLERALRIKQQMLDANHPGLVASLNNLAVALDSQGRPDEAEPLFREALAITLDNFGESHLHSGVAMGNVAWVSYRTGDFNEASELYKRALGMFLSSVGRTHRNVAILLQDWSLLHIDQEQWAEAEQLLLDASDTWAATDGHGHANTRACLEQLATVYEKQGKLEELSSLRLQLDELATTASG